MGDDDRLFIFENFFSANRQRMIEPNQRYLQLLYLAGDGDSGRAADRLRHFKGQDLLDLQVWFFLSWTGEAARRNHPVLQELVRKGKNFSQEDKELLFALGPGEMTQCLGRVKPESLENRLLRGIFVDHTWGHRCQSPKERSYLCIG